MRTSALALVLLATAGTRSGPVLPPEPPAVGRDSMIVAFTTREGTRLAADVSPRDGSVAMDLLGQLWIVPANGGVARAITDAVRDTAEDLDPSFSPDGRRLLFQSDRPGGRALWLIDVEGGTPTRVTHDRVPYYARAEAAWAPDGNRFVYVRGGSLVVHELDTGEERSVRVDGVPRGVASSPSWSADGRWIAFVNGGRRSGVWRVPSDGGTAESIGDSTIGPTVARLSPSGDSLALIAPDSSGRPQLWVQPIGGVARRLTSHDDLVRHRVRWTADGRAILYSADGRLWRVPAGGGAPTEIPFTASIRFVRRAPAPRPVSLASPGHAMPARGFTGLALSPDASRIAMLALDSLWVWKPGEAPRAVSPAPGRAHDLVWLPDSRAVGWSAGLPGAEDVYVTNLASGVTRAVTAIAGSEVKPAWSPDGRHVAFLHSMTGAAPWRVRVQPVTASLPHAKARRDSLGADFRDLGPIEGLWMPEQGFVWTPDSRAIVTYVNPVLEDEPYPARVRLRPLDDSARTVPSRLHAPTFASWFDSTITYVQSDVLWRATMRADGTGIGSPRALGEDPALGASAARDGTVLYLSGDGLRLRRPDGTVERLGWPLTFRTPPAPPPLLVRNVHLVDGTGAPAAPLRDVLLEQGRIRAIGAPGSVRAPNASSVDAAGRFAMPGLIDMHAHFFPETQPAGLLYHGVTTARDVGSQAASTAALRDAVEAGVAPGPRIVIGGFFFLTQGGVEGGATGFSDQAVGDSAGLERAMRLADALGAGYVKHRTFDAWSAGVRTIAAAHRRGLPVSGHCVHILPLVAAGMDGKEHSGDCFRDFGLLYSDFTQLTAAAGLWVDATAGLFAPFARAAADSTVLDSPAIAPWLVEPMRRRYLTGQPPASLERPLRLARARTAALRAAGVPVVAGTDQAIADGIHWELEALVHAGLTPSEAIAAATSRAAHVLGAGAELGVLAVGKRADLVIVDADPTLDITNTRRIWRVVQGGRIVDREALLRGAPNPPPRSLSDGVAPRPRLRLQ